MVNNQLKKLGRRELIEIIYQMKKNEQRMQEEIAALQDALADKRIRLSSAGTLADAAVSITKLFSAAQETADVYLREIDCMKRETEEACRQKVEETNKAVAAAFADSDEKIALLSARYQQDYEKWQQLRAALQSLEEQKH